MNNFTIVYDGKWPSINEIRRNTHKENTSLKNKYRKIFWALILEQRPKKMTSFKVLIRYNSNLDPDNVSYKFLVDAIKDANVIKDDNKKYSKGCYIEPDESLPRNRYVVLVADPKCLQLVNSFQT